MTKSLHQLEVEGHKVEQEMVACLSPHQTEHMNGFGLCILKRNRVPEQLDQLLRMPAQMEGAMAATKIKVSVTS
jgi:hypothetical protein